MREMHVTAIATTPVKGLRLHARERVQVGPLGVVDNRAFFLVDARGKLVNGKRVGQLTAVRADLSAGEPPTLTLSFPDGSEAEEAVDPADPIEARFFSLATQVAPVCPRLSAALSRFVGSELTIVRADPTQTASDRGPDGVISLMSTGSLRQLGEVAGAPVDGRRFRMLFEVDGLDPHREDAFVGRDVRIGEAVVRFGGHVGRCRITSMDPDTGEVTLPTLDLLAYRRGLETTEPLAFGIYGGVREPGAVSVGDRVIPL